jgi:hypothetical protein
MEALIAEATSGQFRRVWAAFDGQAFVIDDILQ